MRELLLCLLLLTGYRTFGQEYSCKHSHAIAPSVTYRDASDNTRSDTIDVLHYEINLDITDFAGQTIAGNTVVKFTPKMNGINTLSLDLLTMIVDSVTATGSALTYSYNDTLLVTNLPATMNIGDTLDLTVYYHGSPAQDPGGVGGWYWDTDHAYNLGVSLNEQTHNYGRVWHPCFDNFAERATYTFNILTDNLKVSYCNGLLDNELTVGVDSVLRTWIMSEPIPSYLANVAVAEYTHNFHTYTSYIYGSTTPVWFIGKAADLANMSASFTNIDSCIGTYEAYFGEHAWSKVGFVLVPFSGGAVEHATNITYPKTAANGTLQFQSIMAHEMAHHWFGDLVTCEYAEEMWLNEGMAEYSSFLFSEVINSRTAYNNSVRKNHAEVLRLAHHNDNGYHALNNIPQAYTYGDHAYNKGADVAHTLRSYLGDSVFFEGLRTFVAANQFGTVTSTDMETHFNAMPGVDVTDFFNDWVYNPGFPHFSIDSFSVSPNGAQWDVQVYLRQKLTAAPAYYNNVPLEVTFMDASRNGHTEQLIMSGQYQNYLFTIPIEPVFTGLDMQELISDALVAESRTIDTLSVVNLVDAEIRIDIDALSDTAFIRVEHNWTAPDQGGVQPWNYVLSPNRYWRIDGVLPSVFAATARLDYEGDTNATGYYDHDLMVDIGAWTFDEGKLVLLYRPTVADDWVEYPYYSLNTQGSSADKSGRFDLDSLLLGEYVIAIDVSAVGVEETAATLPELNVYPNPTDFGITFDLPMNNGWDTRYDVDFYDLGGSWVLGWPITAFNNTIGALNLIIGPGEYIAIVREGDVAVGYAKVVIR